MSALAPEPEVLTRAEAARVLRCSVSFLAHHPPAKGGPPVVRYGTLVRYLREDLIEYMRRTAREDTCRSTDEAIPAPGGIGSRSEGSATAAPPSRGIARKQRKRSAELARQSKPTPLVELPGGKSTSRS